MTKQAENFFVFGLQRNESCLIREIILSAFVKEWASKKRIKEAIS